MIPQRVLLTCLLLFSSPFSQAIEPPDGRAAPDVPPLVVTVKHRSLQQLQAGLRAIADEGRQFTGADEEREQQAALLRLRSYRFLCSVPQAKLTLDAELAADAVAVADICDRLGKLSHEPENPDLPEEEYQRARTAAGRCNLSHGPNKLTKAIDLWMDDSDEHNLETLGHRRWCLNPTMQKLGFGRVGDYCAMWALDSSGPAAADYDVISFPPPGYVPIDFFGAKHAWSITLNPAKYAAPELEEVEVELFPLAPGGANRAQALEIENLTVDTQGFGVSNCLIFQPQELKVLPGKSYVLEIRGLQTRDDEPVSLTFPIHFVAPLLALTNK
jgi:hypothetical protein